ncbi:uncharacterized protein mymx isoform X2 [Stigmatopora argus]
MYSQHAQEGGQLSSLFTCCSTLHLSAAHRLDKQTWTVAMSESIVKKIQPFTIGTKLSVPAVPKCQELTGTYLQSQNLDNCTLPQNLNSLYLSRQQVFTHGTCQVSQNGQQVALVKHKHEDMAAEDHLNQNDATSSAVSRSIKKITISGNNKSSENTISVGLKQQSILGSKSKNHNNNNNISSPPVPKLPRIVGVNCENEPKSHFKVLLKTQNGDDYSAIQGQTKCKLNGQKSVHQAESWSKIKVQDVKDETNIKRCPLQDWDEASQILQRDLKDFDNTIIQLNQTGDHLICKLNPTSDVVKNQLTHLKDQWNILKQTAASQSRVLGCSKNLQEFNKKVDKLETWIKEKEGEQYLVNVLGANVDKIQLTRRILDLKQDEQLYRTLHEEINHMALKLEKQGKSDSKSISSRRKNINKMWLKVQSHLKKHQDNLHIALEVSSFYQQADNTLFAINHMMKSISSSKEPGFFGDREIRDIASQIMMLDVSVSQLSNLHPALAAGVTQKQSEVRDCWVSLQKVFRSDRTALLPVGSTFAREDADPLTSELRLSMGTEIQTTMGKQNTERQSQAEEYLSTSECCGSATQSQAQQCANHTSLPMGDGPDDVIISQLLRRERKPRGEPKRANALKGHTQLPIQLQKFTVSADKTLSWLKENISMATQICSIATFEGLEAARRCQNAVQEEILTNKARVEVVKKEGHGLVRAQHPGSAKIGQFLSQLEMLWDELQKRHQRNAVFLQASEDIGFRVVKVLQALGILEAWLESVELSMKNSTLAATDPKTKSIAELEKEISSRGRELIGLRQEVEQLHGHSHPHIHSLPSRIQEVDKKYQRVLRSLTQQSSEMQDTDMLTDFLENVTLEDSQEHDSGQNCLNQPLHSISSSIPDLRGLQKSQMRICDPVNELREAVEMLNDKARERRQSQTLEQSMQELLSMHVRLSVCMEECLCSYNKLDLDILEKETEMAVQCEPDHCGFETLQKRNAHLQIDYEVLSDEVKEMESQASRLKELCPERVHVLWTKMQTTLQVWAELEKSVMQIKSRMQEFLNLQEFFRSYLAMISWTENTRLCVFSETRHKGEDGLTLQSPELDIEIEQKLEEFEKLAASGRNILDKEHHLTQMIAERMEELHNMLGWISVHWRMKKQEWLHKKRRQEPSIDNIYTEATLYSPSESTDSYEICQSLNIISEACKPKPGGDSQILEQFLGHAQQPKEKQLEDGYEVMKSIGQRGCDAKRSASSSLPLKVIKEPNSPALGGLVNLILSFGNSGERQLQVGDQTMGNTEVLDQTSESFHRPTVPACKNFWKRCQGLLENTLGSLKRKKKIYRQSANEASAYLHIKDNNSTVAPVYESITPPPQKSRLTSSACPTALPTFSTGQSPQSSVSFHPLNTRHVNNSIFCSLKRMGKKRRRKRDTRRHTIQKIMGVDKETDEPLYACETFTYDTHTWPLKEARRKKKLPPRGNGVHTVVDKPNALLKDIELECTEEDTVTPYAVSAGPSISIQERGHHTLLSLGSVLSFDLPKDISLIPSIQEIITIAPQESSKMIGIDPDPNFQRQTALSSFKQSRTLLANAVIRAEINSKTQAPSVFVKKLSKSQPDNESNLETSPAMEKDEHQRVPCNHLCDMQDDAEQEWDEVSSVHKTAKDESPELSQDPIYANQATVSTTATRKRQCPNIHTLIRDLNGHKYHKSEIVRGLHDEKAAQSPQQASHMVVNLMSNVKFCQGLVDPQITGMVGKRISLQVGRIDSMKVTNNVKDSTQEHVHLNHQQFEEEEEELEGIWDKNPDFRQSICSDIMYQTNRRDSNQPGDPIHTSSPNDKPATLYRNLATSSEPNLFVADFRLPSNLLQPSPQRPAQNITDRRSWAAFPNRDHLGQTLVGVNETAADKLRLPDFDHQKYIYQYRQEEEDEEEHKAISKYQSDGFCHPQKDGTRKGLEAQDMQEVLIATSGHCGTVDVIPELQSMEGTLERKQKLQLGGKKAASRSWNSYHTVLYRHTLCFYQDRRETLRSSACGLPLNLTGAECLWAPEYTKKANCFCLR